MLVVAICALDHNRFIKWLPQLTLFGVKIEKKLKSTWPADIEIHLPDTSSQTTFN